MRRFLFHFMFSGKYRGWRDYQLGLKRLDQPRESLRGIAFWCLAVVIVVGVAMLVRR